MAKFGYVWDFYLTYFTKASENSLRFAHGVSPLYIIKYQGLDRYLGFQLTNMKTCETKL